MNNFQLAFINSVSPEKADALLTGIIANAVEEKQAVNRAKGKAGWHTSTSSTAQLKADLERLVKKGDMVDVMIVAGMIHAREGLQG